MASISNSSRSALTAGFRFTSSASASKRLQCVTNHLTASSLAAMKMSTSITPKSFSQGSECPPLQPGTLRLYNMRFCPFAQRTRLVLEHKRIPYETVNIDLMRKPDWFLKRNPLGLVPVLELNDKIIYESLATMIWLDDVYPEMKLHPVDPYEKAKDNILIEYFSKVSSVFYAFKRSKQDVEKNIAKLVKYYKFYEDALAERGGPFFGGASPALVDFFVWPHMERIPGAVVRMEPRCAVDRDMYPYLARWFDSMYTLLAVKETMFDDDTHVHFLMSLAAREPDYDYGLQ